MWEMFAVCCDIVISSQPKCISNNNWTKNRLTSTEPTCISEAEWWYWRWCYCCFSIGSSSRTVNHSMWLWQKWHTLMKFSSNVKMLPASIVTVPFFSGSTLVPARNTYMCKSVVSSVATTAPPALTTVIEMRLYVSVCMELVYSFGLHSFPFLLCALIFSLILCAPCSYLMLKYFLLTFHTLW